MLAAQQIVFEESRLLHHRIQLNVSFQSAMLDTTKVETPVTSASEIQSKDMDCNDDAACIKPDTPINIYTRFCLKTAKSKFSLVSPIADW